MTSQKIYQLCCSEEKDVKFVITPWAAVLETLEKQILYFSLHYISIKFLKVSRYYNSFESHWVIFFIL